MKLDLDPDHLRARVVQDAMAQATSVHWHRRARDFEWARPRSGDYTGRATPVELAEQDARLAAVAAACRHRAELALGERLSPEEEQLVWEAA